MNISTQAKLISTGLVAFAIAAPIAHGDTDGTPLSRAASQNKVLAGSGSYPKLKLGEGFSFKAPSYWSTVERRGGPTAPDPGQAYAAAWPSYRGLPGGPPALPAAATDSSGFDWADAGIGAAFVAGLGILGVVGLLAVRRRHGAQLEA
jgi:hypothetical protein